MFAGHSSYPSLSYFWATLQFCFCWGLSLHQAHFFLPFSPKQQLEIPSYAPVTPCIGNESQGPHQCLVAGWWNPSVRQSPSPPTPHSRPLLTLRQRVWDASLFSLFHLSLGEKHKEHRYLLWQAGLCRGELLLESRWDKLRVDRKCAKQIWTSWCIGHVVERIHVPGAER